MRVMIQLRDDAALELHRRLSATGAPPVSNPEIDRLLEAMAQLRVSIVPVHPGQTHPLLAPYFVVEVPERDTADRVISGLQQFGIVEAAYLQPDPQPS